SYFDDMVDSLKRDGFLTEKNARGHKYDSVTVVTFDPSGSDSAFAYLFQKYTGLNVEVKTVRSVADLPTEGNKFLVFADPAVGSDLELALLEREQSGQARLELPAIDRELSLLDLGQSPNAIAEKIAGRLGIKTTPNSEPVAETHIDKVGQLVGNAEKDA